MYKRKTKDIYRIMWNGEIVDTFDDRKEAHEMAKEYRMAFHSPVSVVAAREKIEED